MWWDHHELFEFFAFFASTAPFKNVTFRDLGFWRKNTQNLLDRLIVVWLNLFKKWFIEGLHDENFNWVSDLKKWISLAANFEQVTFLDPFVLGHRFMGQITNSRFIQQEIVSTIVKHITNHTTYIDVKALCAKNDIHSQQLYLTFFIPLHWKCKPKKCYS